MILTVEQIRLLFERLRWEPVYQDEHFVLAKKRRGGYSDNLEIARIEAALSIMGEVAVKSRTSAAGGEEAR